MDDFLLQNLNDKVYTSDLTASQVFDQWIKAGNIYKIDELDGLGSLLKLYDIRYYGPDVSPVSSFYYSNASRYLFPEFVRRNIEKSFKEELKKSKLISNSYEMHFKPPHELGTFTINIPLNMDYNMLDKMTIFDILQFTRMAGKSIAQKVEDKVRREITNNSNCISYSGQNLFDILTNNCDSMLISPVMLADLERAAHYNVIRENGVLYAPVVDKKIFIDPMISGSSYFYQFDSEDIVVYYDSLGFYDNSWRNLINKTAPCYFTARIKICTDLSNFIKINL